VGARNALGTQGLSDILNWFVSQWAKTWTCERHKLQFIS